MIMFRNETRADIAVGLTLSALRGAARFIGHRIFATWGTTETGGTVSVAQNLTGTATVGRAHNATLTGTQVAGVDITYAGIKIEDRATLDEKDVKNHGGEDKAILAGARTAVRGAMLKTEARAAAKVFTAARYAAAATIDAKAPWKALAVAAQAVKDFGDPVLVCCESWLNDFLSIPMVGLKLRGQFGEQIMMEIVSNTERAMQALGIAFGVKYTLIGDDRAWKLAGMTDAAAVVAVRAEQQTDPLGIAKELPCYGLGPTFLPDVAASDSPFQVDTGYLVSSKVNVVDVTTYFTPVECNAAGAVLVKLPAELAPAIDVNIVSGEAT